MTSPPAAVIFDLDGCLVDSEPLCIGAIAHEIRQMGVDDITYDDIRTQFLGVSMQTICDHVAAQTGRNCPADFVDRVEARIFEEYRNKLKQIDGVIDMLTTLRDRNVAIAIATGGSVRRMTQTLEIGGLTGWFKDVAFSADQVEFGKPAPDLFLLAAGKLGVSPTGCAVLEDSPHGVQGAVAAGMQAVGFVGGSHLEGMRDVHSAKLVKRGARCISTDLAGATRALLSGA